MNGIANNIGTSVVRKLAASAVGALIAFLGARGLHVPNLGQTAAVAGATAGASTLYYTAVRLLEKRWPKVGHLLGVKAVVSYVRGHALASGGSITVTPPGLTTQPLPVITVTSLPPTVATSVPTVATSVPTLTLTVPTLAPAPTTNTAPAVTLVPTPTTNPEPPATPPPAAA